MPDRLGANSLLDIVVFGKSCADNIAELNKPNEKIEDASLEEVINDLEKINYYFNKKGYICSRTEIRNAENYAKTRGCF